MELKRVLTLPTVCFIAIGFMIGGGVFVFTGIVYPLTGRALPLAYALAAVPVFISLLPLAMLSAAVPTTGGNYIYPSRMVSPALAFVGIWVYALASFFGQIPLYALGCARYAQPYLPNLPPALTAAGLVTFFFLINWFGVQVAARIQGALVVVLLTALAAYACFGAFALQEEGAAPFFAHGPGNLLLGTALLTFTYFGANGIIELGGEIRKPGRVIPSAFFIAVPVVMIVYVAVALATAAVLPGLEVLPQVEPLIQTSRIILGRRGAAFFVFGGAIVALTTTLNALFIVGSKSLLMIVEDRLLPAQLGRLHPRFGTPHVLLTVIWALALTGIFVDISLETLASYAALGGLIVFLPVMISALRLPRLYPQRYRQSEFKLTGVWLYICPAVGILMVVFFSLVILMDLKTIARAGWFGAFVVSGILYYCLRRRHLAARGLWKLGSEAADDL